MDMKRRPSSMVRVVQLGAWTVISMTASSSRHVWYFWSLVENDILGQSSVGDIFQFARYSVVVGFHACEVRI